MNRIIFCALLVSVFVSCNKAPGEGGTSSIEGKIYRVETNVLGDTLDQYYAADYDVYIIYGDENQTYDDKFSTSYDGSYRFSHLTPGTYTVFAYTRCDLCGGGDTAVSRVIEIAEKESNMILDDLVVFK